MNVPDVKGRIRVRNGQLTEFGKYGDYNLISPLSQSFAWGLPRPYDWQKEVLTHLFKPGIKLALSTPNEAGKTSHIITLYGLAMMAAFPGCQVVSTAGVWRQIDDILWPVLQAKLAKFPDWKIVEGKVTAPARDGLPPSTWNAFSADDAGKAEGWHARREDDDKGEPRYMPLVFIVDEAKSVKQGIFEAMYRCDPDFALVTSTPGEDSGPFFKIFNERPKQWTVKKVTWSDCPHLCTGSKKKAREAIIEEYGLDHGFTQSMVFGEFYRSGQNYIFEMGDVDKAMSGTIQSVPGERRAAVDLSGGGDEQVFMVRDGNAMKVMETWREKDATILASRLIDAFTKFELIPEWIKIDEGGLGDPIIDLLESRGWHGIERFNFAHPAADKEKYFNCIAEYTYALRHRIMKGDIFLLRDEKLREQMRLRRFSMPNIDDSRIRLEQKSQIRSRGEQSPDRLDTLVMLYADMPDIMGYRNAPRTYAEGMYDDRDDLDDNELVSAGMSLMRMEE